MAHGPSRGLPGGALGGPWDPYFGPLLRALPGEAVFKESGCTQRKMGHFGAHMGPGRGPLGAKIPPHFGPAPEALLRPFWPAQAEMHSEDWGAWPYAFRGPPRRGLKIGPKVGHFRGLLGQARARAWRGSGGLYGQIVSEDWGAWPGPVQEGLQKGPHFGPKSGSPGRPFWSPPGPALARAGVDLDGVQPDYFI